MALRPAQFVAATASFGAALTLAVVALPFVRFAYRSPSLHVAIETSAALVALLASYLVLGRFRQSRNLDDLLLACALTLLGLNNLVFAVLPASFPDGVSERFAVWSPTAGGLVGALVIAAAAIAPRRRVAARSAGAVAIWACLGALTLVAVLVALLEPLLPTVIDPTLSPDASGSPRVVGNPVALAAQLAAAACFTVAAAGYLRRANRTGDALWTAVAGGTALAAFARLNYFLFPSYSSEWVYTGDVLRLAFYAVLVAGAAVEIRRYQVSLADVVRLQERRRIARDLHDGLAQELAYAVTQLRRDDLAAPGLKGVTRALERALDDSRRVIDTLTRSSDEPLSTALASEAHEVAGRTGAYVDFSLDPDVDASPAVRETLLRIAREAVSNAARHAHALHIRVELSGRGDIALRVIDDGVGFDTAALSDGFGLISMEERASAFGGVLTVTSSRGGGTRVEVTMPAGR